MIVLSLESAAQGCSVCLLQDAELLALKSEPMERGQDARLVPLVQEMMGEAGLALQEVDRFSVTRGPGSFTGIRIGLAAARGFGLALEKPVLGFDRFRIYRHAFREFRQDLLILLESKRLELYRQFVRADASTDAPDMRTPDDLRAFLKEKQDCLVTGDAEAFLKEEGVAATRLSEPEVLIAARLAAMADVDDPDLLPRPLYLRAPDVTGPGASNGGEICRLS
jgi:tRNA threonylcarbamoyladenosine biosynthesis protein TsaB